MNHSLVTYKFNLYYLSQRVWPIDFIDPAIKEELAFLSHVYSGGVFFSYRPEKGAEPEFQTGMNFLSLRHFGIGCELSSNADSKQGFGSVAFAATSE